MELGNAPTLYQGRYSWKDTVTEQSNWLIQNKVQYDWLQMSVLIPRIYIILYLNLRNKGYDTQHTWIAGVFYIAF